MMTDVQSFSSVEAQKATVPAIELHVGGEQSHKRRRINNGRSMEIEQQQASTTVSVEQQSLSGRRIKRKIVGDDFLTDMKALAPNECAECKGTSARNARNRQETLLACTMCKQYWHPSCAHISDDMRKVIVAEYPNEWQCDKCKTCYVCKSGDESKSDILMCSRCDRGVHCHCVRPRPLSTVPEGDWFCMKCTAAGHRVLPPSHVVMKASNTPSPPPATVGTRTPSSASEGNGSARGKNKGTARFGVRVRTDANKQTLVFKALPTQKTSSQLDNDDDYWESDTLTKQSDALHTDLPSELPPPPPLYPLNEISSASLPSLTPMVSEPRRQQKTSSAFIGRAPMATKGKSSLQSPIGTPRTVRNLTSSVPHNVDAIKTPQETKRADNASAKRTSQSREPLAKMPHLLPQATNPTTPASNLSEENARLLNYVAKVVRRYNRVNPAMLTADDAETVRGASKRLFVTPESQCDLRDFMPMPSLDDAQSFRRKSVNEVTEWARTLNIDDDAVKIIERECLDGATLWDMSPQEMRALDPALRLGYAYRINRHIRMFKYVIEEAKKSPPL